MRNGYTGIDCGVRDAAPRIGKLVAMLLLTTVVPIFGSGAAFGQAATAPSEGAAAAGADEGGLGEILVTARRRTENLQSTPVSATVLSGADALQQNVRGFQDLRGVVSNLEVTPQASGGAAFTVRGIGQTSNQVNVDSKTGFYVDEMYVARQEANSLYFYDIGSMQVLKGPQGTLFGKNTTAGAVLLTTHRPTDNADDSYVTARIGSYKRLDTEGGINIPISSTVLTRFSFRTQNANGYIKHVVDDGDSNDVNDKSARFQLRVLPTDALTIDLLTEYNQQKTDGSTSIAVGCRDNASYVRNYNALHAVTYCKTYPILGKDYLVYGGSTLTVPTSANITDIARGGDYSSGNLTRHGHPTSFNDSHAATVNLRASYDLSDQFSVKSISAYRDSRAEFYNPTHNAPNDIYAEYDDTSTEQFTQEYNLSGSVFDDRLNFVAGLYYFYQKTSFLQDTGPDWIDPLGYIYDGKNLFKSYAAFLQGSLKITPELELTVGGRYSHDKKKASSYVFYAGRANTYSYNGATRSCGFFIGDFLGGLANCAGQPFTGADEDSWSSFDPKLQLSYQFSRDVFGYASYSKGYNAGGFNQQLGNNALRGKLLSYDPEKLEAYEVGLKTELFDRRVRLNVSGFYQKYDDIQTTVLVNLNGIDTRQVQTGASAHQQGFEAEIEIRPIPDLSIRANGAYLEQKYDSIRPGVSFTLDTPIGSAPKYTYNIVGSYTLHPGGESEVTASVDWRAVGKKAQCNPNGSCYAPAYGLLGGRIDLQPSADSPWRVAVFGRNLLDKVHELSRNYYGSMGIDSYQPGRPQEFGLEVTRRF